MYVAMTRARNHLTLTYPVNVYSTRRGSDYSIDQLSRFLHQDVRDKMQRVIVEAPVDTIADAPTPQAASVDLLALLRGRFRAEPPGAEKRP